MAISWLINGGDPNYLRPSWDDPPSRVLFLGFKKICQFCLIHQLRDL